MQPVRPGPPGVEPGTPQAVGLGADAAQPRPSTRAAARHLARAIRPGWLLAVVLAGYAVVFGRLIGIGVDDLALVGVFSADEELSGRIVRHMVAAPTLSPSHFFAYGALSHELAALIAIPISWFRPDEQAALLGLRLVALGGGLAGIALTYLLGARLYNAWAGLAAAVLVALTAEVAGWSVTAHPDTLQLALIAGCLLAVCGVRDRPDRRRIVGAAALAGLAFATKYGGVLLLPLILLAALAARVEGGSGPRRYLRDLALDVATAGAVFVAVFLITNPYVLPEWRRFITQFRAELAHTQSGHVFTADEPPWRWLALVGGRDLLGPVAAAAALVGATAALLSSRARRLDGRALVALWTLGYLVYLVIVVRYQAPRYALPLVPGAAVLAAGAARHLGRHHPRLSAAVAAGIVALTALVTLPRIADLHAERRDRETALASDPRVLAGRWIGREVPAHAAVLADAYVYVPGADERRRITFGLTEHEVREARPLVIATNEAIRGRFRDPADAARYVDGPAAFRERAAAYAQLESGALGCYTLIQDLGSVKLYADESALAAGAEKGCGATR
jgi:4-amino-4-deoxy-L-arabinose transferase-like glycosyltransferase